MTTTLNTTWGSNAIQTSETLEGSLDFMYIVLVYTLLEDKGFRFNNPCVGVLLRADLVLTTLSCLEVSFHGSIDINLMLIYVRNSQVLKPERVYIYPHLKDKLAPNVALIVCEPSKIRDFPKLPEKEFKISDFEYCYLCGFGKDEEKISLKNFIPMRINRSDMEMCSRNIPNADWFCLHFKDAQPCRGDVGAPLLCGGALHAIFNPHVAPWAEPECQDVYGAAFSNLYPAVPWIKGVNSTAHHPLLRAINQPWCWLCLGVTALTITAVIYYALMKYVDWATCRDDDERGDDGRVVYVSSSEMSRVSGRSTKWQWPRRDDVGSTKGGTI